MLRKLVSTIVSAVKLVPPEPIDSTEPAEVIERLYSEKLKSAGIRGCVRVVVSIDSNGKVIQARAAQPSFTESMANNYIPIIVDGSTGEELVLEHLPYAEHPELWRIAEAAARAQRFRPAMRRDRPVAYRDYICTYCIGASARASPT